MAAKTELERVVDELTAIKRLIIYALQKDGISQDALAKALGINQSSVSRMFGDARRGKRAGNQRRTSEEVVGNGTD
jgi:predicted transcriptional regulator